MVSPAVFSPRGYSAARPAATLVLALVFGLSGLASTASAQTLEPSVSTTEYNVRTSTPIVGTLPNACSGEMVAFEGTLDVLTHVSESSTGSITIKKQQKIRGTGIGQLTGNDYRVFQVSNAESVGPKADFQYTETTTDNSDLNGPLRDDHFILQFKTHLTVRPGGIISVWFQDFKTCCPGSDELMSCQPLHINLAP